MEEMIFSGLMVAFVCGFFGWCLWVLLNPEKLERLRARYAPRDDISQEDLLAIAKEVAPHAQRTLRDAQEHDAPIVAEAMATWTRDEEKICRKR